MACLDVSTNVQLSTSTTSITRSHAESDTDMTLARGNRIIESRVSYLRSRGVRRQQHKQSSQQRQYRIISPTVRRSVSFEARFELHATLAAPGLDWTARLVWPDAPLDCLIYARVIVGLNVSQSVQVDGERGAEGSGNWQATFMTPRCKM
ncbi:hypothetical protein ACLKA6_019706 [Drosophila palustris]